VFGVLGVGLSLGSGKEARSAAFGLSLAVICGYYMLLRSGEQAAANGLVSPSIGAWTANAVLGAAAVLLLWMRQRERGLGFRPAAFSVAWLPPATAAAPSARRPFTARRRTGPGLLDRYVAGHFVRFGGLVLLALAAAFVLFDYMD